MSPSPVRTALATTIIALAVACGLALGRTQPATGRVAALEWLDAPRAVAPFHLVSKQGPFTADSLRGRWQLLLLGFSHCPDLCPATLSQLAALQGELPAPVPRIVFVSVDPLRDGPRRLSEFVGYFGNDIIGVTGADGELRQLAQSLGMDFRREGPADAPVISHSPAIAVIGPGGELRALLRPGFNTRQAARELAARIGPAS